MPGRQQFSAPLGISNVAESPMQEKHAISGTLGVISDTTNLADTEKAVSATPLKVAWAIIYVKTNDARFGISGGTVMKVAQGSYLIVEKIDLANLYFINDTALQTTTINGIYRTES